MDEYIERSAATKAACDAVWYGGGATSVTESINALPAADVEPVRHGRWLDGKCTACGWEEPDECIYDGYETVAWKETPYCPKCGAKMQ